MAASEGTLILGSAFLFYVIVLLSWSGHTSVYSKLQLMLNQLFSLPAYLFRPQLSKSTFWILRHGQHLSITDCLWHLKKNTANWPSCQLPYALCGQDVRTRKSKEFPIFDFVPPSCLFLRLYVCGLIYSRYTAFCNIPPLYCASRPRVEKIQICNYISQHLKSR